MTDQLTLELEVGLPRLPRHLRPMLARSAPAPFDSAAYLFEPSWGGERALAFIEPIVPGTPEGSTVDPDAVADAGAGVMNAPTHALRLLDRDERDLAPALGELIGLPERVGARSAVLDGELVVVDRRGRPDPAELARRLKGHPGRPVVYLAFDLLNLDGRPLLGEPLERRRALLGSTIVQGAEIVVLPAIAGEGRALHEAVAAQGIAGIMCRQRRSPYLAGVRSSLWQFVPAGAVATAGDDPGDATDDSSTAPVLALISRLPLDD